MKKEDLPELGPYLPPFFLYCTQPLSCLPVFHQLEILVEMVLFFPSTLGFISGFTGFLCFNLPLFKFFATLPKIHLFLQTKTMLADQTNNDQWTYLWWEMTHKCCWKSSKSLRVASFSARIRRYQSPNLTLRATGSQTAGKVQCPCVRCAWIISAASLGAWLSAILNFSLWKKGKVLAFCLTLTSPTDGSFKPLSPENKVPLFPMEV